MHSSCYRACNAADRKYATIEWIYALSNTVCYCSTMHLVSKSSKWNAMQCDAMHETWVVCDRYTFDRITTNAWCIIKAQVITVDKKRNEKKRRKTNGAFSWLRAHQRIFNEYASNAVFSTSIVCCWIKRANIWLKQLLYFCVQSSFDRIL